MPRFIYVTDESGRQYDVKAREVIYLAFANGSNVAKPVIGLSNGHCIVLTNDKALVEFQHRLRESTE